MGKRGRNIEGGRMGGKGRMKRDEMVCVFAAQQIDIQHRITFQRTQYYTHRAIHHTTPSNHTRHHTTQGTTLHHTQHTTESIGLTLAYAFFWNTLLPHSLPKLQILSPLGLSDSQHSTFDILFRQLSPHSSLQQHASSVRSVSTRRRGRV